MPPQKYVGPKRRPATIRTKMPDDDRIYTDDEREFLRAVDEYKRRNSRVAPTWPEVLAVAASLGYRKVAEPAPLPRYRKGNQ